MEGVNVSVPCPSSDIVRVNHHASEILSALEPISHDFVLKRRLRRWKEEWAFKLP